VALRIVRETMRQLAFALSHATHLIHPQTIIIGGGLSLIGEPLRAALAEELKGFLMDAFQPGPVIALAALKEDAVPVGAVVLASRKPAE
jgi:glucokinase